MMPQYFQLKFALLPILGSILAGVWITIYFGRQQEMSQSDPSSFADSSQIKTRSLNIVLVADLNESVLSGYVDIEFERINANSKTLILDSKDLQIVKVSDKTSNEELLFAVGEKTNEFGSPLSISLLESTDAVTIHYKTSPLASGVQVLKPEQTLGKHPYLFTQCQAIHARSIVPCQDTPGVKTPYTAQITVDKPLVAVMSAVSVKSVETPTQTTYFFNQKIAIPSYLIAIVIGDIVSRDISDRVRVWSERANIEECYYEFQDTDDILKVAESIAGPYVWGRYDLVVLPPSFPYGGMENPCLTFVTPTLLAGDRSLVNVVAHEIAHSWTGNLVTNANWEHFWLNEGFTVFLERKILGKLAGSEAVRQAAHLDGLESLKYSLEVFGQDNPLTALHVNLKDVDPDDAFSSVPYEKGSNFLFFLENLVGGPAIFNPFLKNYIQEFSYKSITSDVFVKYFQSHFPDIDVEWEKWLNSPGMPLVVPDYDDSLHQKSATIARAWSAGVIEKTDVDTLNANQVMSSLKLLHNFDNITLTTVEQLDKTFHFGDSHNSEILFSWYRLCIKTRYEKVVEPALKFVTQQGRMKYVRPIYRDLAQWDKHRSHTIDVFNSNKDFYHSICANMLEKDFLVYKS